MPMSREEFWYLTFKPFSEMTKEELSKVNELANNKDVNKFFDRLFTKSFEQYLNSKKNPRKLR